MTPVANAWWAVTLRGAAALALAVFVAVRMQISAAQLSLFFGAYALVDGVIATGAVIATGLCACGALLLIQGLSSVTLGMASIYAPQAAPLYMIAWALVIGSTEIFAGNQVECVLTDLRESRSFGQRLSRHASTPSYAYQLAGAIALAFAGALAVGPTFQAAKVIVLLGLFAAIFGYLHFCVGLNLGLYVVEQTSSEALVPRA